MRTRRSNSKPHKNPPKKSAERARKSKRPRKGVTGKYPYPRRSPRVQRRLFPGELLVGDELISILSFLSWIELGRCQFVCRNWYDTLSEGNGAKHLWRDATVNLWSEKVYVPKFARAKLKSSPKEALKISLHDAIRSWITLEELTTFAWDFRFKELAGDVWTNDDPWWNGRKPRKVAFHCDELHRKKRCPRGVMEWFDEHSGEERQFLSWKFLLRKVHRITEKSEIRYDCVAPSWRAVQVQNFPGELILRTSNWGWVMHSTWVVYTSFPLPIKGDDEGEISDQVLHSKLQSWQWQGADEYNRTLEIESSSSDESVNDLGD